jgi:hypothetical protein
MWEILQPVFVLGTWIHIIISVLLRFSSSVVPKMILIYLPKMLARNYTGDTHRNFRMTLETTVQVDRYRIGRVLEISFMINNLVLKCLEIIY